MSPGDAPADPPVSAPKGYSIYSAKAEAAAAAAGSTAPPAPTPTESPVSENAIPENPPAENPRPESPRPESPIESAEDAALLRDVEGAVAGAGPDIREEAADPPAGYSIFAEDKPALPPMTPEEAAREAAEDAELLGAVDAAVTEDQAKRRPMRTEGGMGQNPGPDSRGPADSSGPADSPRAARVDQASAPAAPAASAPPPRRGWAGSLLAALLLLLIGGGLALWLGPKVAPNLPQGMAPVANWLNPGGVEAEARVAAISDQVRGLGARIDALPNPEALGAEARDAVTEAETRIDGEIAGLRDQLSAAGAADFAARLARLEASLDGQTAELSALKGQIGANTAAVDAAPEAIDLYRGEIDALRAEMGALSDKVSGLTTRVDEVAAEADRQVSTAQATVETVQTEATTAVDAATRQAEVASVVAAVADGQPFAAPLARLAQMPDTTIPADLTAAAETGVLPIATLRDRFPEAAHAAIRASIIAGAGDGIVARSEALLRAQFATRALTPREGVGPDAVLSRAEEALRHDDLAGALAEIAQLPSEGQAAMGDWLTAAKLRAGAEAGLATLTAPTPATN